VQLGKTYTCAFFKDDQNYEVGRLDIKHQEIIQKKFTVSLTHMPRMKHNVMQNKRYE
jgi:hypothetical protein